MAWLRTKPISGYDDTRWSRSYALDRSSIENMATKVMNWDLSSAIRGEITDWINTVYCFPLSFYKLRGSGFITKDYYELQLGTFIPNTDVAVYKIINLSTKNLMVGSFSLKRKYFDFRDYEPYTSVELYLPFYGFITLKCADCEADSIYDAIYIYLSVDFYTGGATYYVVKGLDTKERILGTYNFQLGIPIPIGQSGSNDAVRNILLTTVKGAAVAAGAYFGNVAGAGVATTVTSSLDTITTTKKVKNPNTNRLGTSYKATATVERDKTSTRTSNRYKEEIISSAFRTASNAIDEFNFRPTFDRPSMPCVDRLAPTHIYAVTRRAKFIDTLDGFKHLYGKPLGQTYMLGALSGYTECGKVHVSGDDFIRSLESERSEIEMYLHSGVILPESYYYRTVISAGGKTILKTLFTENLSPTFTINVNETGYTITNSDGERVYTYRYDGDETFFGVKYGSVKYKVGSEFTVGGKPYDTDVDLTLVIGYNINIYADGELVDTIITNEYVSIQLIERIDESEQRIRWYANLNAGDFTSEDEPLKIYSGLPVEKNCTGLLVSVDGGEFTKIKSYTKIVDGTKNADINMIFASEDAPVFSNTLNVVEATSGEVVKSYEYNWYNFSPDITLDVIKTTSNHGVTVTNMRTKDTEFISLMGDEEHIFAGVEYDDILYSVGTTISVDGVYNDNITTTISAKYIDVDPSGTPEYVKLINPSGQSGVTLKSASSFGNIEYSEDGGSTWVSALGRTSISTTSKELLLRGTNAEQITMLPNTRGARWCTSALVTGDLRSLISYEGIPTTVPARMFFGLFLDCDRIEAPPVIGSGSTYIGNSFEAMCMGCSNLKMYTTPRDGYSRPWIVSGNFSDGDPFSYAFRNSGSEVKTIVNGQYYYVKDLP